MVSLKNIDICPIYGPKSIIFGAYAQIWAYSILLITFLSNFDEIYIQVFKRLAATSRAPQIMVLSMLRSFGKIGPQIDQIWAWLSRGHRWSAVVQNPLKSSVTGPSLLVNCYLEIKFHKIISVNPPPPPLRSFGKIGPQIDQIWAWLSRGHRWSPGVRNPLKSSVTGPSLLVNCYLEIKFHKIISVNPPPPPPPPLKVIWQNWATN